MLALPLVLIPRNPSLTMKARFPIIPLLILLAGAASAEKFVMKDGTVFEGRILREDAASYFVEVQVTKSIKDERTLAKAEVVRVEREQPDLKAFEEIAGLYPVPDEAGAAEYDRRIKSVERFVKFHRASPKAGEAKTMLEKLKSEANEVLAGGIRLGGRVVPAAEYRANAYEFDARVKEAAIRNFAKQGDYLSALRAYGEFSTDFRNTTVHAGLQPFVARLMTEYLAEIQEQVAGYDARLKERQVGLDRMDPGSRAATQAAIAEETAAMEARLKKEKDARVGWVTTDPMFKPSLDETLTFGRQELTRVKAAAAPAADAGKLYRDALALALGKGDKTAIAAAISAAKAALVPQRYIEKLEVAAGIR